MRAEEHFIKQLGHSASMPVCVCRLMTASFGTDTCSHLLAVAAFADATCHRIIVQLAEAKPRAPPCINEALGFPDKPIRDARSAEWELMNPLSLTPNVQGHGFQMHHCPLQARGPAYALAV